MFYYEKQTWDSREFEWLICCFLFFRLVPDISSSINTEVSAVTGSKGGGGGGAAKLK
jgi:hypothetical protein